MCVCVCMCMCAYARTCMRACVRVHACVCVCVHACMCVNACMCVCACVCSVCVCMRVYACMRACTHVCVCMCVWKCGCVWVCVGACLCVSVHMCPSMCVHMYVCAVTEPISMSMFTQTSKNLMQSSPWCLVVVFREVFDEGPSDCPITGILQYHNITIARWWGTGWLGWVTSHSNGKLQVAERERLQWTLYVNSSCSQILISLHIWVHAHS